MPKEPRTSGYKLSPCKTELGKFIRERRMVLGLGQIALAEMLGVKQQLISQLETGHKRRLSEEQAANLSEALHCDPEELSRLSLTKRRAEPKTELSRFIRSRRLELGLTLEAFAAKAQMTLRQALSLETKKNPGLSHKAVKPLARALAIEPSSLVGFTPNKHKEASGELGGLIRRRRLELALSLGELARMLGVTAQLVSQIELEKFRLSSDNGMIEKIAQALGLEASTLAAAKPKRRIHRTKTAAGKTPRIIASVRFELQISQRELATRTELPASVISGLETGRIKPTEQMLGKLAAALGDRLPDGFGGFPSEKTGNLTRAPSAENLGVRRPVLESGLAEIMVDSHGQTGITSELEAAILRATCPEKMAQRHLKASTKLRRFLTSRRNELGLSQRELAERARTSIKSISCIETGRKQPDTKLLDRLSAALGCRIPPEMVTHQAAGDDEGRKIALGWFIAASRKRIGFSPRQLARLVRTSPKVIAQIEAGEYNPGRRMLRRISSAVRLEIPADLMPPQTASATARRRKHADPVRLKISSQALTEIESIIAMSSIKTKSEAVRKSLQFLRWCLEKQRDRYTFLLRRDEDTLEAALPA